MALFLNGKQIDKENVYADNIPMSASDSDTIAEKFDGLTADLLPIESGSSTNTKDYIDSGLSGKADSSDVYTQSQVDTLLGGKLDSSYLVKTNNGNFAGLVANNQVWLISVMRVSVNTSCVLLIHNYNGNILVKEIVKDSGMAYITNNQGTVSITYSGSGESVRGGAYRLY